jgi:hypothetical protein
MSLRDDKGKNSANTHRIYLCIFFLLTLMGGGGYPSLQRLNTWQKTEFPT